MTNFNFIVLFLFIQQSITQNPPVVPLTNALTTIYCHNSDEVGLMTIRCGSNEKIRMLDAFDVVVKNKSHLPFQCLKPKHVSLLSDDHSSNANCKIRTSFASACSGRENCTLHMQRIHLNSAQKNCQNELVDYTMAFFECISDVFIHDVCFSQAITSAWGTLKTPNFPNPYTSNDDCWCKLSTQLQYRLLLSVIAFQLIPYDQNCVGAGLYLQSSDQQRSTQCTYLQQGHNYLSDTNSLYINFYSRTSTVRGGFWLIYEASHPNAEVHLHCGSREKIGVPSSINSILSPPISSSYNHGWSRLAYNNPPNPTAVTDDYTIRMRLLTTTAQPFPDRNLKVSHSTTSAGAFTYPYGRLTTFELDYGPRGWFLKYLFGSSNMTATRFIQTTTSRLPVVKWNSTWRYFRRPRPRIFTTGTTTTTTTTTIKTTTTSTTILTTTSKSITTGTSTILTTEQVTIPISSTAIATTTPPNVSTQQRVLSTHTPWISDSTSNTDSSTAKPFIQSTMYSSTSSFTSKTTLPLPTPWYSPDGPFDWWQWQWHTTKRTKIPLTNHTTTTEKSTTTTITTNPTTTRSLIDLNNKTKIRTLTRENTTTVDWFKWPHSESTSTTKGQSDDYEEEYSDWPDYFATTDIQPTTRTTNSLVYFLPERQRQKFQQMNFLPTKSNPELNDHHSETSLTPAPSRHSTQQHNGAIGGRIIVGSPTNGVTEVNTQNNIQDMMEETSKKSSEENDWFSRTDVTIVAVSILFVTLLVVINLIIFAVRRHRHRAQGQHFLSTSSLNSRRIVPNDHLQHTRHGIPINSLINNTNNNNNDILPAVGEIVIWDQKDQGGYTIDNQGEWSKIDGRQWFGNSLLKSCSKTSFSKSFRSRFQFIRQSNKKSPHPQAPRTPQQALKYPLLMDTASLSPVPEIDDYRLSDMSSETTFPKSKKTIQALIHKDQEQSDEYYKRIEMGGSDSNYTTVHGTTQEEYSIADQQMNRCLGNEIHAGGSVMISVPTMLRAEDDMGITTDGGDSIYNQHYSIQSFDKNLSKQSNYRTKPPIKNSIIVGHCQADIQPLEPKLLFKFTEPSLLADHLQFYNCSQSFQLSTYDSGFFDDQTMNSLATTTTTQCDELEKEANQQINMADDEENFSLKDLRKSSRQHKH